jgi:hypothetical protein
VAKAVFMALFTPKQKPADPATFIFMVLFYT